VRPFRLSEEELDGGCTEIQIEGELDLAVAGALGEALERADSALILIDLTACEFIDSTGIAVIVQAYRTAAESGRRIAIHGSSAQVHRVLTVTGLTANGLAFEDRQSAVAGRDAN
jgi:anti-sigma B factor antagonist